MTSNRDELERDIKHQREILTALRDRLRVLELKEARLGISADPAIVTEIRELAERIQRHEIELARLQTEVAIDKEPLIEVEYRALLAAAWDTSSGQPTVAGAARIAFERLRLGIVPVRAEILEKEIRSALVTETFNKVPVEMLREDDSTFSFELNKLAHYRIHFRTLKVFTFGNWKEASGIENLVTDTLRLIGRCIRLDLELATKVFAGVFPHNLPCVTGFQKLETKDMGGIVISSLSNNSKGRFFHPPAQFPSPNVFKDGFTQLLKDANNVRSADESTLFSHFLEMLQTSIISASANNMLRSRVTEFDTCLTTDNE